jgi:alginate production protein
LLAGLLAFGLSAQAETVGRGERERAPTPAPLPLILEDRPQAAFDIDAPPPTANDLTPSLSWGARLELELEARDNRNLDDDAPDRRMLLLPEAGLALSFHPTPQFQGFLNLILERDFALAEDGRSPHRPTMLTIDEAHITLRGFGPGVAFRFGRQSIQEAREWYYDDELDGARIFFGRGPLAVEASISRLRWLDQDLLNPESNPRINNYILSARYRASENHELQGFAVVRDDLSLRQGRPVFLGARALGTLPGPIEYALDVAYLTGLDAFSPARGDNPNLSAWGLDGRATWALDLLLSPSLTLGAAFGSGDANAGDGTGHAFRQTGLQDNNGRYNGVTTFQYYGEVFDPELSNMAILTAGVGVKPSERSSIDLVYHHYRQHRAAARLRRNDLNATPAGRESHLGDELDLVIGVRDIPRTAIEVVLGWFRPGDAFGPGADNAFLARFEVVYRY